jgi:hypothetical protein
MRVPPRPDTGSNRVSLGCKPLASAGRETYHPSFT